MRTWRRVKRWAAKWWKELVVGALLFFASVGLVRRGGRFLAEREREQRELAELERRRATTERTLATTMRATLTERAAESARRAAVHEGRADQAAEDAELARAHVETLSDADVVRRLRELDSTKRAKRKRGGVVGPLVVIGAVILGAPGVEAQSEPVEAPHPVTGERGVWLEYGLAREVLADVEALEHAREEIAQLRAALEMRDGESQALRSSVDLAEATARAAAGDAVRAWAALERERVAARVWWRRPSVLLGVGAVIGAGVVTAIAIGVQ